MYYTDVFYTKNVIHGQFCCFKPYKNSSSIYGDTVGSLRKTGGESDGCEICVCDRLSGFRVGKRDHGGFIGKAA